MYNRLNLNEYFFIEYCNKWAGIIDHLDIFDLLARIIWIRLFTLFESYISENGESVHMMNCTLLMQLPKCINYFSPINIGVT